MRVLLTNSSNNAGVIVARALARAGHEVCGATDVPMPFGLRSRHLRAQYVVPAEDDGALCDALLGILRSEHFDALLPFAGVDAVAARRAEFSALTGVLAPDTEALAKVSDKGALPVVCERFGVPAPRVYARDQAEAILRRGERQLVVKPARGGGGGRGISFVRTTVELDRALDSISADGVGAVISEYIPGGADCERAVHLLLDRESRLIASFSLQKSTQSPLRVGITAAAVSTRDVLLVERIMPMLKALRWQGPLDVEWKFDARDGEPRLIEINPRFSGAIGFPIALGVDMATLCAAASAGVRAPEVVLSGYAEGVRYINPGPYLHVLPARLRQQGVGSLLAQMRGEFAGRVLMPAWDIVDPGPLVGKLLRRLARMVPVRRATG